MLSTLCATLDALSSDAREIRFDGLSVGESEWCWNHGGAWCFPLWRCKLQLNLPYSSHGRFIQSKASDFATDIVYRGFMGMRCPIELLFDVLEESLVDSLSSELIGIGISDWLVMYVGVDEREISGVNRTDSKRDQIDCVSK